MSQNLPIIQSLPDFLYYYTENKECLSLEDKEALSLLGKIFFKYTECGIFIKSAEVLENGRISKISVGSIVEGSEAQTQTHVFSFPFHLEDWNHALKSIEEEAKEIWESEEEDSWQEYLVGYSNSKGWLIPDENF